LEKMSNEKTKRKMFAHNQLLNYQIIKLLNY